MTDALITGLNDEFFKSTYLGFSYVVPETTRIDEVQKNFSQLFRNINYFGKKLEPMDSRKSLYYQNQYLTNFFEGKCDDGSDIFGELRIIEDLQPSKIDFVRYLAILSQYLVSNRHKDAKDVMVGYSAYSSRESYYADYVSYILGVEQEDRTDKFNNFQFATVFPNNEWKERFIQLRTAIERIMPIANLKDGKSFNAWYEADYWLFGLIFHILFLGNELKDRLVVTDGKRRNITLSVAIEMAINADKKDASFAKNANRITYIRERLVKSCIIYKQYVQ